MGFITKKIEHYIATKKKHRYLQALDKVNVTPYKKQHNTEYVNFSHIGLNGDIIYSIPAMLALAVEKNIHLYLDVTKQSMYTKKMKHYNQDKILTPKSVDFITPLLTNGAGITKCTVLQNEIIDYDLNEFRQYPFDYRMGHISRWYFLAFGVTYNLSKPWLHVEPNQTFNNAIVIARSFRYRALGISYRFLEDFKNIYFVGMKDEFDDLKNQIPSLKYLPVSNAFELAQVIAGSKLFIGNQSFPFSIAEGLKVKRVLEVCYECPNVIVDGDNGYDFCFQQQFEKIINDLI
jgi:hypothetical protein